MCNWQGTWDQDLQLLAEAIRTMKNCSTRYNVNMMMLLMDTFQPVDILMGTEGAAVKDENPSEYLCKLCKTLPEVHRLASEHLKSGLCYQKKTYDLKLQQAHFKVGDFVYKLNAVNKKGECKKLKPIWIGPLVVTQVISPVLYHVRDRCHEHVLHHDQLKLCEDHVVPMWLHQLRHKIVDLDATIAYDEAEQELDEDNSARTALAAEEVSPLSSASPSAMTLGDEEVSSLNPDNLSTPARLPEEVSPLEPADFIFDGDDWGLENLFKEQVHIYAKVKQSPPVENRSTEPETSTDVPCSQAGTVQDDALLQNDTDGTKSFADSQL